ncbi:diguanylate cyclase [Cellvibrio sp. OA-2007]|uniref:diguanylate cyclase n=1 Tax=Cellvibrio sp. OA-2007 TaxID=529823 RepID=UPI000784BD8B|nr:diguanylate cyclase [Cellvibrio sp. OA-2007]
MNTTDKPRSLPKLLIVDDQPINIRVAHELFRHDCEVYMATNGEQALAKARALLPDLILLDVVMPGMSGHEVCQRIKADPLLADIAIIFVTAHYDEADEVRGFELGAVDFIHKPINPTITRVRVHNQLLLKQQRDQLRSIALMDGLTGIANRRKFETALNRNWLQCARDRKPLSMFMIDVDYFKKYNDHYGHQEGDNCLKQIAQTIDTTLVRPSDLGARFGGEEFACLLPGTDRQGALYVAAKIEQAIRALAIPHQASDVANQVTVSIGCSTLSPTPQSDAQQLIAQADEHLYNAKNNGRNQISAD